VVFLDFVSTDTHTDTWTVKTIAALCTIAGMQIRTVYYCTWAKNHTENYNSFFYDLTVLVFIGMFVHMLTGSNGAVQTSIPR